MQDGIQLFTRNDDLIIKMKKKSVLSNDIVWYKYVICYAYRSVVIRPIYSFVYLFMTDILASSLLIWVFAPRGPKEEVETLRDSQIQQNIKNNDDNESPVKVNVSLLEKEL